MKSIHQVLFLTRGDSSLVSWQRGALQREGRAGAAISSPIKGRLALPKAALERLITHPLSGLHGSFLSGRNLSIKVGSSSFSGWKLLQHCKRRQCQTEEQDETVTVVPPNACRAHRALAHVNLPRFDVTPALSRHLPGLIKVTLEPNVCDSFENLQQSSDEALICAHL